MGKMLYTRERERQTDRETETDRDRQADRDPDKNTTALKVAYIFL